MSETTPEARAARPGEQADRAEQAECAAQPDRAQPTGQAPADTVRRLLAAGPAAAAVSRPPLRHAGDGARPDAA
ncbi:hypothetical protein [Phaeacidiphilus oryzae]|uniref:hypothetical protein n=1 Tax=Phaeacidiphilus oryzae TaxID=348818 RepID=UPI00055AD6B3|nr:hypothetical protein [Phaeacidiphilus oryzae]